MKKRLSVAALAFAMAMPFTLQAHADECHDKFTKLLVDGNEGMGPSRIHLTQEIVGGMTTKNWHYSDGKSNGMSEMIEPENMAWSMFLNNKMYTSADKGKTWTFVQDYDAQKSRADGKIAMTKDAAEATEVKCSEEEIEGVAHDVVEGNYISSMTGGGAVYQKYWVSRDTGWITKSYMHMKTGSFESKTTQLIESYPDLVLPDPG